MRIAFDRRHQIGNEFGAALPCGLVRFFLLAVEIADVPGSLASVLYLFRESQVNIEYMYALAGTGGSSDKAVMVFRFSDNDRAIEILLAHRIKLLNAKDFGIADTVRESGS